MLDRRVRAVLDPRLRPLAAAAGRLGATPGLLTLLGLLLAVAAGAAAGLAWWLAAAVLWLLSRVPDGLDGALARASGTADELGGFRDILADFVAYGGFVVGIGVGAPQARVACLVLLLTYYANGTAFLAFSSVAARLRRDRPDERSLHFTTGLAEGTETIAAHTLFVLVPAWLPWTVWAFAAVVAVTVVQRVVHAHRALR